MRRLCSSQNCLFWPTEGGLILTGLAICKAPGDLERGGADGKRTYEQQQERGMVSDTWKAAVVRDSVRENKTVC